MNPTEIAIRHHYLSLEKAIDKLVDLYKDDYDITDRDIFNATLARYGLLDDGFCSEEAYIIQEVKRRLAL
jgi:hypothetical protein